MPSQKQTSSPQDTLSSHKRLRFWIFVLLILLLLFGGAYVLWGFLQQPVVGTVGVVEQVLTPTGESESPEAEKQYQGTYLTFTYPATYEEKRRDNPFSEVIQESVFFAAKDIEGQKIAMVVEERTERTFEASPAFQMRMNNAQEYTRKPLALSGLEGFIFTKESQVYEVTAFFRHNTQLVTLSLTSPFTLDGLEKTLLAILESLKWYE